MITNYGNVGTGLDDKAREELWAKHQKGELVGEIIECCIMEWTPAKKMRHPRFKRVRWDKDTENLEKNAKRWKKHN
jgi:ATP-dependent DNA ligase